MGCTGKTGVEMEALSAVSVACLTVYDRVKGMGKSASIGAIEPVEKSDGKAFMRPDPGDQASSNSAIASCVKTSSCDGLVHSLKRYLE